MTDSDELQAVVEEERRLVLERFDEAAAFILGGALYSEAAKRGLPIVIDIRLWDRRLFYAALPGSSGTNANWTRRKINVVRLFHKSSFRMVLEQRREDRTFPPRHGLDEADYVLAGGAFPLRVATAGIIGAIAVSGLSEREDHALVTNALRKHLQV